MAKELSTMKPLPGERRERMRIGRGEGSGKGKTAGKGTKGAQARSGYSYRDRFEGGQMPLARRLPKKGFHNRFAKEYTVVRLGRLAAFAAGSTVTPEALLEKGIIAGIRKDGVKVVGGGELGVPLHVRVSTYTASAAAAIVAAGGTTEEPAQA